MFLGKDFIGGSPDRDEIDDELASFSSNEDDVMQIEFIQQTSEHGDTEIDSDTDIPVMLEYSTDESSEEENNDAGFEVTMLSGNYCFVCARRIRNADEGDVNNDDEDVCNCPSQERPQRTESQN